MKKEKIISIDMTGIIYFCQPSGLLAMVQGQMGRNENKKYAKIMT